MRPGDSSMCNRPRRKLVGFCGTYLMLAGRSLWRRNPQARSAPASAPMASAAKSSKPPLRPGRASWCHSSRPPMAIARAAAASATVQCRAPARVVKAAPTAANTMQWASLSQGEGTRFTANGCAPPTNKAEAAASTPQRPGRADNVRQGGLCQA